MILILLACTQATPEDSDTVVPPVLPWTDLTDMVERARTDARVPALLGAEISPEGIVALGVSGRRVAGEDAAATLEDAFHLGSNTKSMTGTLAGVLVDAGTVTFDTTVGEVWPHAHAGWQDVTLEDLLKHQSGAAANPPNDVWIELYDRADDPHRDTRSWLADTTFAEAPPNTRGTYTYSNTGIMLAGALLEAMADRSWDDMMQTELFDPLQMDGCGLGAPDEVWGHQGNTPIDPATPASDNPPAVGPAGTAHCPIQGYAPYLIAHLTQSDLLTPATWQVLHTPASGDYAAGWVQGNAPWSGGPFLGHQGSNTLWLAEATVAPGLDRAFVVLTNRGDANASEAVADLAQQMIQRADL